jgi:hypothetical protein
MKTILFKKGIKTMVFTLGFLPLTTSEGSMTLNPTKEINDFKKKYKYTKKARIEFHADFNNGTKEIRLCK